ncbi:Sec-independent protein translocase protein TatB [Bradyrhizobium sp.]|jgi:sec-independent protein translocase protein TatB|uniref:Sec-independent protein translocase protein TatB n=1 Tax=Bradyrhizobium sp. TaxID=376 RepID=UPI002E0C89D7|nr:Sec-independent protein translocase protein TatB [Bradyrhizobium sp.]
MFDIGWSELVVIAVVALIAIGPKELPGVLRMVGQWMGKARKMAAEFQGQFQEAMREAEMADLKKTFNEVKETATGFASDNIMTSLQKDVGDALKIDDIDKPALEPPVVPATPEPPTPETFAEAETNSVAERLALRQEARAAQLEAPIPETFSEAHAHALASQPLAITREVHATPPDAPPAENPDILKDAKAS